MEVDRPVPSADQQADSPRKYVPPQHRPQYTRLSAHRIQFRPQRFDDCRAGWGRRSSPAGVNNFPGDENRAPDDNQVADTRNRLAIHSEIKNSKNNYHKSTGHQFTDIARVQGAATWGC